MPATDGAVYEPVLEIAPPAAPSCTLQVTAVLVVFVTVAENARVPPVVMLADAGEMETATAADGAVTFTTAVADFVVSAWLVATT